MTAPDFTTTIVVEQTPKEAFDAITNVRGWWSEEIEGNTSKLHDEFAYHYEDMHRCKMKLIEVIPDSKIVWLVMENYFDFTKDKSEWTGTTIRFEISKPDGKPDSNKTQIRFTHVGLVPEYECYDVCKEGWSNYINKSLRNLITKGKGQPNATGKPRTASEEKLKTDRK
ncbi:MAG TPA: SRPBCC domain-containing protein [Bacteroidia bacterium]|nr:SRPBCC domain-containing protein [Bacteroidia bacterium]